MTRSYRFPDGFIWGAATSAYQIEGSPLADGAGPSIWQRFAHTPGMMANGDHGDVACDHYRRYKDDVRLMRALGLHGYRFSVAWARVLPEGTGRVNQQGLDFYSRLVDELLENDIDPNVTLFHWDLPAALDDRGGWLNRDSAHWFTEYASVMFKVLDDRVKRWSTINEPWVVTDGGYLHGALAPGHRSKYEAPIAAHNLMRASGAGIQAYRAVGRHEIGVVFNIEPKYPASQRPEDIAATRRAHAYMNEQFADPALLGSYPPELKEVFGDAWPDFPAEDFQLTRQPVDFVGINYYTRSVVKHDDDGYPCRASRVRQPHITHTETDWEVYEQGLTDTLMWFKDRYGGLPLYVTENGAAFYDPPAAEGDVVEDPLRVAYLRKHLRALHQCIENGVNLKGYYAWSLLDNLEWSLGFAKRFGLYHVDYASLKRTPKASAKFYAKVIETNGEALA
ncbi:GH1 family beta-glucosidase [Dyella nitratireducens]|uniref:Beta-glucosidase n=1 Tax=Dyella nitratireducens TaxID=1849580 RepID=A0ABQ1FSU0_9GAMM|nr:GH1 family beta-glucosidase [Dyella nitratireducens]GGA28163.1 beta-glucosidase [Dyella nitratireducens]GLQ43319.1 beta-glucosidase [Dyella nitratireducens]